MDLDLFVFLGFFNEEFPCLRDLLEFSFRLFLPAYNGNCKSHIIRLLNQAHSHGLALFHSKDNHIAILCECQTGDEQ